MKLEVQTHHLQRSVLASDSTHESDDDARLSAVLLQSKNKYSSSAKPSLSPILADDNDTAASPKSGYLLCVCVCR